MSGLEKAEQEKGNAWDKEIPAARTARPGQDREDFEPIEGPPRSAKDFLEGNYEEPLVKENPPSAQSHEEGSPFSPSVKVVQADGNGAIVAGCDWKVETLDGGTRLSIIHDSCAVPKTRPKLAVPGSAMV